VILDLQSFEDMEKFHGGQFLLSPDTRRWDAQSDRAHGGEEVLFENCKHKVSSVEIWEGHSRTGVHQLADQVDRKWALPHSHCPAKFKPLACHFERPKYIGIITKCTESCSTVPCTRHVFLCYTVLLVATCTRSWKAIEVMQVAASELVTSLA